MPSTIYNEGRVVGFSAYEIYVRHALCEDPTTTPASELEWLSSSIATGSSMLLKISAETAQEVSGHHIINIPLPADSNLAAANTIIGSLFIGEAEVDADGWATKVTSYGPLIENNATNPTAGDHSADTTIPPTTYTSLLSDEYQDMLLNYVKVVDGIVVQPGHWSANNQADQPPHKDFSPDLSKRPFVKIYVSDTITEDFYLLLTGFTLRTVLAGISGLNGSTDTDTNFHNNGGFLGPAVFPWANKIVFSVPPAYVNYFIDKRYERAIQNKQSSTSPESFQDSKAVKAVPVIDMESTDPATYYTDAADDEFKSYQMLSVRPGDWSTNYTKYFKRIGSTYQPVTGTTAPDASGKWPQDKYFKAITPSIKLDVTDANTATGDRVLTIYQRSDLLPPALYATKVTQEGETKLYPVDTVAPGTVKLFENDSEGEAAKNLEDEIPGNRAFIRNDSDYVLRELNEGQNVVPVAEVSSIRLDDPLRFEDLTPPFFSTSGGTSRDGSTTPSGTPADLENDRSFAVTLKRITGKLSSKIQELCGYEYDSDVFTTGIWAGSVKRLKDQISLADQDKYYYIVNAKSVGGTPYVFPVRKSDHVLDITIPYETRVYVNGSRWYPIFSNHSYDPSSTYPDSVYLGNYWWGNNLNSEKTLAGVPAAGSTIIRPASTQKWAYIIGAEHPTRKTRLADVSGQIDNPTAILPADKNGLPFEDYYKQDKLSDLYTESYLTTVGINSKYWSHSLDEFLKEALYTDMGTGLPLSENNPNRTQTLYLCSNGTQEEDIHPVLSFSLSNNEATVGKAQYVSLPEDMIDDSTSPIGTLTQTGNKQSITLSMADRNAKLYNFKGDSGNNIIPEDGNLHWNDLLDALANNKSIEILRAIFPGFGIAMRRKTRIVDGHPVLGWEIINDKPYIGDGVGYTRLTKDTHFKPIGYNGFIGYNNTTGFDIHGTLDNPEPPLTVSILPSSITRDYEYEDDGEIVVGQIPEYINISISGGNSLYTFGKALYKETNYVAPIKQRGFYVGDSASYEETTSKPDDWDTHYTYYFTKTGGVYTRVAYNGGNIPTWRASTYYKRLNSTAYEYVKLMYQPDDWATNYTSYYKDDAGHSIPLSTYPSQSPAPPTFEPDTYYEKRIKWNRAPGFNFYHANNVQSDTGKYSWTFGVQFQPAEVNLVDGTILDLKPVIAALEAGEYNFRSTASSTSGIWNVVIGSYNAGGGIITNLASPRASWGAYTNMFRGFTTHDKYTLLSSQSAPEDWSTNYTSYFTKPDGGNQYTTGYDYYEPVSGAEAPEWESDKYYRKEPKQVPNFYYHPEGMPNSESDTSRNSHIFAATVAYADGYNTQFNAYDSTVRDIVGSTVEQREWEGGKTLYGNLLNMDVSCIFYLT